MAKRTAMDTPTNAMNRLSGLLDYSGAADHQIRRKLSQAFRKMGAKDSAVKVPPIKAA